MSKPSTVLLNADQLVKVKHELSSSNEYEILLERLIKSANEGLGAGPYSVSYKESIAPSGDKHDYLSVAPYWWPDSTKPDGLPYIRRDGIFNPEGYTDKYDKKSFMLLRDTAFSLSLGYYFTDNEDYAKHCAKLIKTWFIDKETKMNPNMNYAQGVLGIVNGRKEGVLETERLLSIIDSVRLISNSSSWTDCDELGFNNWLSQYVFWLETSDLAVAERAADNNHGTWYDAQYVAYLIYLGEYSKAASYLNVITIPRIESQIMSDGKMPEELNRTRPFHYTLYNLEPFTTLAILGEKVGVDLWNYQSPSGSSIKKAYDFIVPYILGEPWPYNDIESDAPDVVGNSEAPFARYLREAAAKYNEESFLKAADILLGNEVKTHIVNLISPN